MWSTSNKIMYAYLFFINNIGRFKNTFQAFLDNGKHLLFYVDVCSEKILDILNPFFIQILQLPKNFW